MRSTAACRPPTSTVPPGTTRALPVAKFTSAPATPGCRPSTRWTRTAHEPQVMPCTSKSNRPMSVGAVGSRVVVGHVYLSPLVPTAEGLPGGNLVPLLLDRLDQVATLNRRVVVGHRDRPSGDVNGGALHTLDGAHGAFNGRLAVVTVDLGNRDGLGQHHAASFRRAVEERSDQSTSSSLKLRSAGKQLVRSSNPLQYTLQGYLETPSNFRIIQMPLRRCVVAIRQRALTSW